MNEFEYNAPETVDEAVTLLSSDNARVLAGGTDLIVQMREGRRQVNRVVDLKGIPELTAIVEEKDGGVRIGAALNVSAMAAHPAMRNYPAVVESGQMIGSFQIQNRASIGGNVCNAAPSADAIPALICLNANGTIVGPAGRREVTIESLFVGVGRTTLGPQDILVSIRLPPNRSRSAAKYLRFTPRREMDIAVAGCCAQLRLSSDGTVMEARVALAAVAPTPIRSLNAEGRLLGARPDQKLLEEAARLAAGDATPISDTRGSTDYRRELVRALTMRALASCCAQLEIPVEVA